MKEENNENKSSLLNSMFLFLITCLVSVGVYIFSGFKQTLIDVKESVNQLNVNVARVISDKKSQDKIIMRIETDHEKDIRRLDKRLDKIESKIY